MCKEEYAEPIQLELMEVVVQIEVQAKNTIEYNGVSTRGGYQTNRREVT